MDSRKKRMLTRRPHEVGTYQKKKKKKYILTGHGIFQRLMHVTFLLCFF